MEICRVNVNVLPIQLDVKGDRRGDWLRAVAPTYMGRRTRRALIGIARRLGIFQVCHFARPSFGRRLLRAHSASSSV